MQGKSGEIMSRGNLTLAKRIRALIALLNRDLDAHAVIRDFVIPTLLEAMKEITELREEVERLKGVAELGNELIGELKGKISTFADRSETPDSKP